MGTGKFNTVGNAAMGLDPKGLDLLLVACCYRDRDTLLPDVPIGSYADLTLILTYCGPIFVFHRLALRILWLLPSSLLCMR